MSDRAVKNIWLFVIYFFLLTGSGWSENTALIPDKSFSSKNPHTTQKFTAQLLDSEPDWLVLLANSVIQFQPNASAWTWDWGEGVLMYGLWQAFEATENTAYYTYIKNYVDHYVPQNGNIVAHIDQYAYVNRISPAILLPCMYKKTSDSRYLTAAHIVADYIQGTVRRVSNGALAHVFEDELWIDTLFMACIFLARYAEVTGDITYLDEAVNQILRHAEHLYDDTSHLFYHGWDQNGSAAWADPVSHHSPCFWGRGNGWAVVTLSELIAALPSDYGSRNSLIELYTDVIQKLTTLQEPGTGLWYTVVDRGGSSRNYLETSASAMYVYGIEKGIEGGYLASDNSEYSRLGNDGLNNRIYIQSWNGEVIVHGISEGTMVGGYDYYTTIPLGNNKVWGLGAFLMTKKYFRPGAHKPKSVTDIAISINSGKPVINWQPVTLDIYNYPSSIHGYRVYRSTDPDFSPGITDSIDVIGNNHYTDLEIDLIHNQDLTRFYKICAVDEKGRKSEPSEIMGLIKNNLSITGSTDFNFIALPFNQQTIYNASTLVEAVPACNSAAYWSTQNQGYFQFIDAIPSTNFDVAPCSTYFINVTTDTFFLHSGEYNVPTYNLMSAGGGTHFNAVMLPFDKQTIENASELLLDINGCNSVVKWNEATQGYVQYDPALPETDFSVYAGKAYLVHVTESSLWPERNSSASVRVIQSEGNGLSGELRSVAPHLIIVRPLNSESNSHEALLKAYITSRPDEFLTADSPGCQILASGWIVQCASFPSGWKSGEIVRIETMDDYGQIQYYNTTLTWNPSDEAIPASWDESAQNPETTRLHTNYPNPFNPLTRIPYEIESFGHVNIRILDITGRTVRGLLDRDRAAGKYEAVWNGTDDRGLPVSSGLYLIELSASRQTCRRKILLVR